MTGYFCQQTRILFICSFFVSIAAIDSPGRETAVQPWWMTPQRMIQTNLREIDAAMDLDEYVDSLTQFQVNVVLFNVGGIVANYPTDLPFHYRNPYMKGDLTGEVVKRLHAKGIKIIGRFDFSKINEAIAAQHPEWLYRSEQGETVNYNGQVHTCLNGGYQQDGMFQILGEAIDRYPLDGIFFNMIGYVRSDYSGTYHGICQCDNCRTRFRQEHGQPLPRTQNNDDPVYRRYLEFCRETVDEQFTRVRDFVKAKRGDLAICTYTSEGIDIIRSESNTRLGEGTYADSEKAKYHLLAYPDKMLANTAVHFIDFPQRHASVSPYLTQRRLLQHMIHGTWIDFYCIGPLHTLEDRIALDRIRTIYRFHAAHEAWMLRTRERATIGLLADRARHSSDYRGFYKMLSEFHFPFDLVSLETSDLQKYNLIIAPDAGLIGDQALNRLDRYVARGGSLLLAGLASAQLKCLGSTGLQQTFEAQKGTYIRIRPEDKERLRHPLFDQLDLVYLDDALGVYQHGETVENLLRYIPPAMFGPPEKCYYTEVSEHPGLYLNRYEAGRVVLFPWRVGRHYHTQGHPGHAALARAAIENLLQTPVFVKTDAPPLVEINHRVDRLERFEWVGLINHTGLMETVLHQPVPIHGIQIGIHPAEPVASARLLYADQPLELAEGQEGWIHCTVPRLESFEIVLFEYRQ